MKKGSLLVLLLGALLALPSLAQTQTQTQADTKGAQEGNYAPLKVLGMQVWIDKETGQLRPPTAKESAELAKMMQEFAARARAVRPGQPVGRAQGADVQQEVAQQQLPNGAVMVELGLEHLDFSQVHIDADGKLEFSCGDPTHHVQPEEK